MNAADARTRPQSGHHFGRLESRDFDEVAVGLAGMNTDLRQVSGGPFHGTVEVLTVGSLRIMRVAVNQVIQARGSVKPNTVLISLLTPQNQAAVWRNQRLRPGDLNLNGSDTEIDHRTGRRYDDFTLILDADRLRAAGEALLGIDVAPWFGAPGGCRPDARKFASLESGVRSVFDRARSSPESLDSPGERARVEESLVRGVLNALACERTPAGDTLAPNRREVARRAEESMLGSLRGSLLMTDLCQAVGVSERMLRYAFHDVFGTSPLAYFKMLKLHAIRRHIARDGAPAGVQQIARQWGIVHMGNFAADYRRLFGESPSETARRVDSRDRLQSR